MRDRCDICIPFPFSCPPKGHGPSASINSGELVSSPSSDSPAPPETCAAGKPAPAAPPATAKGSQGGDGRVTNAQHEPASLHVACSWPRVPPADADPNGPRACPPANRLVRHTHDRHQGEAPEGSRGAHGVGVLLLRSRERRRAGPSARGRGPTPPAPTPAARSPARSRFRPPARGRATRPG